MEGRRAYRDHRLWQVIPLGAQIPIWCRLTTQAMVQFHWIKIFVTEQIEYYRSDKRVHRMEPVRRFQLFEKWGAILPTSAVFGDSETVASSMAYVFDHSSITSKMQVEEPTTLTRSLSGKYGDPVIEMYILAQLLSRHNTNDTDKSSHLHCDSTYENIRVKHLIKVF